MLQNLIAYSAQIAALIIASSLLVRLLRLRDPAVRLACFQSALLLCLCLPFVQPWNTSSLPLRVWAAFPSQSIAAPPLPNPSQIAHGWHSLSIPETIPFILVFGMLARALWILLGFCTLYRYRRTSRPSGPPPEAALHFMDRWGIRAEFAISGKIGGPITFGLRSPLILLPSHFDAMNPDSREAILCHELTHVRRKDWLMTVFEEIVLTVLWFHPAVWWLVSEIRLAREQTVDLEVIRTTGSRNRYIEALLEAAQATQPAHLMAVTSFLWRGHLIKRVAGIVGSASMSKRRLIPSLAALVAGTLLVARMTIAFFPISAEARTQQASTDPIQIESGGDQLLHRAPLEYPGWVLEKQIAGLVVVEISTDDRGLVSDAHVISGPQELRRAVLRSVLDWQYDPQRHPPGTSQIAIRFRLPDPNQPGAPLLPEYPASSEFRTARERRNFVFVNLRDISRMLQNTALAEKGELTGQIVEIRTHGAAERSNLLLGIHIGGTITADSIRQLEQSLREIDQRFFVGLETTPSGGISVHVFTREPEPQR